MEDRLKELMRRMMHHRLQELMKLMKKHHHLKELMKLYQQG